MNTRRTLKLTAATAALSLGLASCGQGGHPETGSNALLAYVPEDTPYLAGNIEPVPEDVIEAAFRRAGPVLDLMQEMLDDSSIRLSGSAAEDNPELALIGALMGELDGKLSRQGLESLGFKIDGHQVFYGMDAFPVIRLSLSSAQALRETVGRIQQSSGIDFPAQQHQGQPYWKIGGNHGRRDDVPVFLYAAIIENSGQAHLAIALFPQNAEASLLPAFLGQQMPAKSPAAAQLAELNRTYGYSGHGSGYVDFQRLFDQLADPASPLNTALREAGHDASQQFGEVCRREIGAWIDRVPRMVFGTTELTPMVMGAQYRVELADDLASDLAALVAEVPAVPAETDRLLEFAFGIRVGAARDFMIRKATELSHKSYACGHLQDINRRASEALVKLNTPMPPLINNFLGFRASIDEMPQDQSDLSTVRGTMALHVTQPEMFVGMAQMFLPQLGEFQLAKGDPPVRLPQDLMPVPGVVAYAAMSDGALGIALGEGEDARLGQFLDVQSKGDGSFLSVNYDMATYMGRFGALSDGFSEKALNDYSGRTDEHGRETEEAQVTRARDLTEAFQDAFKGTVGRSHMSLRFDADGFAIDNTMRFSD